MLAKIYGAALHGVEAFLVTIEISVTKGLGYQITGLPDESIRESLSRIAVAIQQAGFDMPRTKLLIHLSPAHIRKSGSAFDLPIAIGILLASGQVHDIGKLSQYILAGELALDGKILPVRGALCMSELVMRKGFDGILIPSANAPEAALIGGTKVFAIRHLQQVLEFLKTDWALSSFVSTPSTNHPPPADALDFKNVIGQENLKRAMEIAAAGGHHALMIGPPGTGKSLVAKCLPSILPPMSEQEMLETTKIYSVLHQSGTHHELIRNRPFRTIHHMISDAGLIGGGMNAAPGEITLAHNGVLFMDEFSEFKPVALEALRQPLEDRKIIVARSKRVMEYPAAFMLVAAMNPCLCGYYGHPSRKCTCTKRALIWYHRKISGPLLDRMDIQVDADPVDNELFLQQAPATSEPSGNIRKRVWHARQIQSRRFANEPLTHCNAMMSSAAIQQWCSLDHHTRRFLHRSLDNHAHSARGVHKILKVARTIADLAGSPSIELAHVAEAIHFRALDKALIPTSSSVATKTPALIIHRNKLNGYDHPGF
jgi:magnesium chelatase family protein